MKFPESITHEQYVEASRPLLELLGVTEWEIYSNAIEFEAPGLDGKDGHLRVVVAARKDGDDRKRPITLDAPGLEDRPHAAAELAWVVAIPVVAS